MMVSPSLRRFSTLPVKRELGEFKRVQISQKETTWLTACVPPSVNGLPSTPSTWVPPLP